MVGSIIKASSLRRMPCLLLLTASLATAATALSAAVPASATDEAYRCAEPCALIDGPDNYVKNVESVNESGSGLCAAMYLANGERQLNVCRESPTVAIRACHASEFYGYGQTRRYYAMYNYHLYVRQTNYQKWCE